MVETADCPLALIIAAAGLSERMGGAKKEFLPLGDGEIVLKAALRPFSALEDLASVVITLPPEGFDEYATLACGLARSVFASSVDVTFVPGGATRQESVFLALEHLAPTFAGTDRALVLIHDGARPYIKAETIRKVVAEAKKSGAAVPGIAPTDTIKGLGPSSQITAHLERASLAAVQTPQAFFYAPLLDAHRKAHSDGHAYTDDSEIWAAYVGPVTCVPGTSDNRKITTPADIPHNGGHGLRIGIGQDRHRLIAGRDLRLGGVTIPSPVGEEAHSDGDVLIHALMDALLGAAAAGDIGERYPDTDARFSGADSTVLLREVWGGLADEGWRLVNADCVVLLERPKVLPHRDAIRASLASHLAATIEQISVKAKTGEGVGAVGEGRAIEAWVSVLLEKRA